jgi:Patatin-like phospholipase
MKNGLAIYAGGNHIFYIAGVLRRLFEKGLKFDAVATYSAGSAILPFLINGNFAAAPEIFGPYLDRNARNFYPANLFTGQDVFPQDRIYSGAVTEIVEFDRTAQYLKPLRVIVSLVESGAFPEWLVGSCSVAALALNNLAQTDTPSIFLRSFKRFFAVEGEIVDVRQCKSREEIIEVILGSSTIYPFIHIRKRAGRLMLDGKLSLVSPVSALHDCDNVLSIHAHHSFLPVRDGLQSLFPLSNVQVGPLNYVGSEGIKTAFAQGYSEGEVHYARLANSSFFD